MGRLTLLHGLLCLIKGTKRATFPQALSQAVPAQIVESTSLYSHDRLLSVRALPESREDYHRLKKRCEEEDRNAASGFL
jgi:hypothetical protein